MHSALSTQHSTLEAKAFAKVNIFLKITGHKDGYHALLSRFMLVEDLYDTIRFEPAECETFTIEGCDGIPRESNTIYQAWRALNEATGDLDLIEFFHHHKVVVEKRIPSQAGLGGGSSDAAAFMRLARETCDLKLTIPRLAEIGGRVGADVPFFVHGCPSANVSGFGEIVEPFDEALLPLEIYTPPIACDTAAVYRIFKERFLDRIDLLSFLGWEQIPSQELLERIADPKKLNDLYPAALLGCPELEAAAPEGWFFSGSGSSFFRPKE
ncbi:4-(cytidine 5'-diphospho)-2-C-methyl-D-erythritol kinase [Nitratifractor sp.]